ncbi:hypothetical protein UY3_07809 [Chelonia mydas]|uniref:Uncharacterized protein n=1 Tax=Chelonia mydas TaxID=8469 RepID=M7BAM8_CHEMY|nr:hypothetical protein UY3_07809 [Chelonia mydas]
MSVLSGWAREKGTLPMRGEIDRSGGKDAMKTRGNGEKVLEDYQHTNDAVSLQSGQIPTGLKTETRFSPIRRPSGVTAKQLRFRMPMSFEDPSCSKVQSQHVMRLTLYGSKQRKGKLEDATQCSQPGQLPNSNWKRKAPQIPNSVGPETIIKRASYSGPRCDGWKHYILKVCDLALVTAGHVYTYLWSYRSSRGRFIASSEDAINRPLSTLLSTPVLHQSKKHRRN